MFKCKYIHMKKKYTNHTKSDLANAFIEGGAQTCAMVSNLPDKFVL
jgi:hypothetical protein